MTRQRRGVRRILVPAGAALLAALAAAPPAAGAARPRELGSVPGAVLRGAGKVAAAGDVNGDGVPDLLASEGEVWDEPSAGRVYVVFGSPTLGDVDLEDLGDGGFVITGATEGDRASFAAPAGDVNGDGRDDVVVGAPDADNNARFDSGSAYVVFGKADSLPVDLKLFNANAQGPLGYRIDGPSGFTLAGRAVDGAGDVNGDGLADVVVGVPFDRAVYVVFGQTHNAPVDLARLNEGMVEPRGFRIETPLPGDDSQMSVSGAGDVNGDGTPDLIVGVVPYDNAFGSAYVVFGKRDGEPVDFRELGDGGIRIKGARRQSATGYAVDAAGDLNRDGRSEVIVGAPHYPYSHRPYAYVVFGRRKPGTIRLRGDRPGVFTIKAETRISGFGAAVAGIGDVDGDRIPDLLVGAPETDFRGRENSGSAYLVAGAARGNTLMDLGDRREAFLRLDGLRGWMYPDCREDVWCGGDHAGGTVAPVGDMNADGHADFAVGAKYAGKTRDGEAYVVWGSGRWF